MKYLALLALLLTGCSSLPPSPNDGWVYPPPDGYSDHSVYNPPKALTEQHEGARL